MTENEAINTIREDIMESLLATPNSKLLALIFPVNIFGYDSRPGFLDTSVFFNIGIVTQAEDQVKLKDSQEDMDYMTASTFYNLISYKVTDIFEEYEQARYMYASGMLFPKVIETLKEDSRFLNMIYEKDAYFRGCNIGIIFGKNNVSLERYYYINFNALSKIYIKPVEDDENFYKALGTLSPKLFVRPRSEYVLDLFFETKDGYIIQVDEIFRDTADVILKDLLDVLTEKEELNQFALQIQLEIL